MNKYSRDNLLSYLEYENWKCNWYKKPIKINSNYRDVVINNKESFNFDYNYDDNFIWYNFGDW